MNERLSTHIRLDTQVRKRPAKIYRFSELRAKRIARHGKQQTVPAKPAASNKPTVSERRQTVSERRQVVEPYRWSRQHIVTGMAILIVILLVSAFQYVI